MAEGLQDEQQHHLTRREVAVAVGMVVYITAQFILPITQWAFPYHTAWGWKMFAYYGQAPVVFRVITAGGQTADLAPQVVSRMARTLRPEVDRTRFVPPAICAHLPSLQAVEFRRPEESGWQRFSCP